MKSLVLMLAVTFSSVAFAEIEFGAIGSYHIKDQFNATNIGVPESTKGKSGFSLGALALYSLNSTLKARTGLQWEEMKINHTVFDSNNSTVNWENLLVPLDLQWSSPIPSLYVFGGGVFALNINGPTGTPAWSDLRADIGVGYDLFQIGTTHMGLELEYMAGLKSVSANPDINMKVNVLTANIVAFF